MRFVSRRKVVSFVVLAATFVAAALLVAGCQVDLSGSMSTKGFYPNDLGKDNSVGDPRQGAYCPGYGERSGAGSASGVNDGFPGLDEEGGKK